MRSTTTNDFNRELRALPPEIRAQARLAYRKWLTDPFQPSLQFKRMRGSDQWSVRIGLNYRALGHREGDLVIWDWIGPHSDYDERARRR